MPRTLEQWLEWQQRVHHTAMDFTLERLARVLARLPIRRPQGPVIVVGYILFVTLPVIRSALIAGALLAFALSFDEIIVTTFTAGFNETLPIWIFANLSRPNQLPIVNAVALGVIIASAIPVYLAQRVASDAAGYG